MGRHLDDNALRIWLELVRLGGYWYVREFRALHFPGMSGFHVKDSLERLVDNGMVREVRSDGGHPRYGVTTLCKAPPGYEHVMAGAPA